MNHLLSTLDHLPLQAIDGLSERENWKSNAGNWVFEASGSTQHLFAEIVPSIQARMPRGQVARIQMAAGDNIPLLDVGWVGSALALPKRRTKAKGAFVDTDLLKLEKPTRDWRLRITAIGRDPWRWHWGITAITWRGGGKHPQWKTIPTLKRCIEIKVPANSQMSEGGRDGRVACSPTTVRMLLAHRGIHAPVPKVMREAFDPLTKIYGNWQTSIQSAWKLGGPGVLCYFRHWDQVLKCLRLGFPVGASIKFPRGEADLPGAPVDHSNGHLLVIRGLTPKGDVITNDPAAKTRVGVPRSYPLEPFSRCWFGNSGMGYLLFPAR